MEQRVLDAIGKAQTLGVPSGLMTGSERFLGEARKAGATLLGVGADTALLAAALRRHAKTLKGALKKRALKAPAFLEDSHRSRQRVHPRHGKAQLLSEGLRGP